MIQLISETTNLELILLDVDLTEEPVHHVTGQEKDVGMTVLIQTNLKDFCYQLISNILS